MRWHWSAVAASVSAAALAGCAPAQNGSATGTLTPIAQVEFVAALKRATGSVYFKAPDLKSDAIARALADARRPNTNVIVLLGRDAPGNASGRANALAKAFGGSYTSMVLVATSDARITPFAYFDGRAYYGDGLVVDGELVQVASLDYRFEPDLEQFNTVPKRVFHGS